MCSDIILGLVTNLGRQEEQASTQKESCNKQTKKNVMFSFVSYFCPCDK